MASDNRGSTESLDKESCTVCKIKVKSNDQAVQCNKCELWQHTTCINMAQTTYNALKKTALWLCDNCLIGMSKQNTTSSSLLNKITILEDKIDRLTKSLTIVQGGQLSYDFKNDEIIERKVKECLDERHEIDKRKFNVIIKGVEESQSENLDERIEDDKAKLRILMVALKVNPDSIAEKVIRLGPKTGRFPHRLLLVSLSSQNVKGRIMREQANYRMRNPTRKIYISPDLSPKQRVENHKLVDELKRRRSDGENVKIKSGKIVRYDDCSNERQIPGDSHRQDSGEE